jgi:hypothetical protein
MKPLLHRVVAVSNLCTVTTFVTAHDDDEAELMGLQQIADEFGFTNTSMFFDIETECEEAQ